MSKKDVFPDDFEEFYRAYPKKKKKLDALRAWKKAKGKPPVDVLIEKVNKLKQCDDWQAEGGKYIPYPASWLNAGGWDDETTTEIEKPRYFAEG